MTDSTNNKRIAKNTIILYVRMVIMMLISLYTSRVVLKALGIDDFGIYQVVGSIIVLFSFLNNGLSAASNRFITAEISKGTTESGRIVFNVCLQSHILIALIIFIFAETIGLWLVNSVLKIPETRMYAANIVYQISIINSIISIISSPYNTTLIAYEKMDIFAYLAVFEAIIKLVIVFLICIIPGDKLILYAFFLLIASVITICINYIYCNKKIIICKFSWVKDKSLLKSIFKFTSWSLLGQTCIVGTNQGVMILVNYFCGVAVNAAMGISNQVMNIVNQFVTNFQTAFRPQIVKSYTSNAYEYLQSLITRSSKITSCLMLVFIVPILFELPHVLSLWLGEYPEYSVEFAQWTLIALFFDNITGPLWMTINAQTEIKKYQIWTSVFFSMNFFLGWAILIAGIFPPYAVVIVRSFVYLFLICVRLYYTKKYFSYFSIKSWTVDVLLKSTAVFGISAFSVFLFVKHINLPIWQELISVVTFSEIIVCALCYMILFSKSERRFIKNIIKTKILRKI